MATIRKKAQVKRVATMSQNKEVEVGHAEVTKSAVLEGILKTLVANGLGLSHLLFRVFDPIYKQGELRWAFFREKGNATRLLNFWMSKQNSATAQEEVHQWALTYVAKVVKQEAAMITKSGELQTFKKPINAELVLGFDMAKLYAFLQQNASAAMTIFGAFSTSTRNAKNSSTSRINKRKNVGGPGQVILSSTCHCTDHESILKYY
jgi:hypothetical protein